jgi:hypothetical protein
MGGEAIDGIVLHQVFQAFRQRRFGGAHRAEQIENLFALFQSLRCVTKIRDEVFHHVFNAIEVLEGGIGEQFTVHENTRQPGISLGVHHLWLADGRQHPLRGGGVSHGLPGTKVEIGIDGKGDFLLLQETLLVTVE